MMDFTVKVSYLPNDVAYGDNEHVLKAHLMNHFEKILHQSKLDADYKRYGALRGLPEDAMLERHHYDIADICFGRHDVTDTLMLVKLHDYYQDVKRLKQKEILKSKNPNLCDFSKDVEKAEKKYRKKRVKVLSAIPNLQDRLT